MGKERHGGRFNSGATINDGLQCRRFWKLHGLIGNYSYISINPSCLPRGISFCTERGDCLLLADRLTGRCFIPDPDHRKRYLLGVLFSSLYPLPLFLINALYRQVSDYSNYERERHRDRDISGDQHETLRIAVIIAEDRILLCVFCLFLFRSGGWYFWHIFSPLTPWDALYYHLPIVGQIMQSGSIGETPTLPLFSSI